MPRGNIFIVDQLRGYERPPPPPPHPALAVRPPELEPAGAAHDAETGHRFRARALLFESFASAGLEDPAHLLLERLQEHAGVPFYWRIIQSGDGLSWELVYRDDPKASSIGRLAAACGVEAPRAPGNTAVVCLQAHAFAEGRVTGIAAQRVGSELIEELDAGGAPLQTWRFVEHRRDPRGLLVELRKHDLWNGPGRHGGQLLWPELVRCKRLALGSGRARGLLHLGLPLTNVLFFCGALAWPEHLISYLSTREPALSHIDWDVSLELGPDRERVVFARSSIHGPY